MPQSSVSMQVKGIPAVYRKLDGVTATNTLRRPMRETLDDLQRQAQAYPPKRPGQTYVRTFRLRDGWRTTFRSASGLVGVIYNKVPYGPYVMLKGVQAWMHQGRWNTTEDILSRNVSAINQRFKRAFDEVLK